MAGIKNRMYGLFGTMKLQDLKKISIPRDTNLNSNLMDLESSIHKLIEERNSQYSFYSKKLLPKNSNG